MVCDNCAYAADSFVASSPELQDEIRAKYKGGKSRYHGCTSPKSCTCRHKWPQEGQIVEASK